MSTKKPLSPPDVTPFPSPAPLLFGALLKEKRKAAGLSQQALADQMHVTRNTVINWEADKSKPDYSLIPQLCTLLDIPVQELFQMQEENRLSTLEERVVRNLRRLSPMNRNVINIMATTMAEMELYNKKQDLKESFSLFLDRPGTNAAGTGDFVPDEQPSCIFLRKSKLNSRADGIAHVRGRSMEPVYSDGDDVYYAAACFASPGQDVIVDTDDGAVIKRVADDYTLYSVNPDPAYAYPEKNDQNTLVIRGIVLGIVHPSDYPAKEDLPLLEELFSDEIRAFKAEHHITDWD